MNAVQTQSSKTCRLVTLGCKVNQYETQLVKEALEQNGYREAQEDESADLCFVNTCTVTSEGDAKSRKVIRQLSRQNPGTRTIVMGCYATRDPESVSSLPNVFEVVTDKRELPDVLDRQGIYDIPDGISYFDGRKRAYVKVQDGCLLKCTYCIIPSVRPGLRSRDPESIADEVRRLVDNGHKEIVISGIHVGHFGVDTTRKKSGKPPFRLWHLLKKLDGIPGDWRMRLSSIEANEIDDDFISASVDCEHLCPQFHPALQSGSDSVLARMRRRYRTGRFLDKLDQFREAMPGVAFTTDLIIGFPGETDDEFQETIDVCRRAKFMKIHIFPFSQRKGTPAATYPDQVPAEVRKARCQELSQIERELAMDYYQTQVGKTLQVLVEKQVDGREGWVQGTDEHYIPVTLRGSAEEVGEFVNCTGQLPLTHSLQAVRES
ncbi:Threonylcarbamoyladenosine tRNA methylthiotransferase MtaB [Thalassoglobus neptunius]|uniref:Threonylcarbamoyladenosine tRNA methylthiotransferase MtaB n=1 Tax=Thalassoglobus neptunius TaxID=1938619 RepID=A0A5C5X433_9PLAN|nr:tRNA (N(6)-L-threonylcarbamoyladenosine(37)-C(2))-methylthiotransferase MtaB [Thalassoglobus neptunius]TWT56892.1 Threonylcarbamoyladenosine tRNA methylthiotransferase MtaB [Thalassoglobus neptunius]